MKMQLLTDIFQLDVLDYNPELDKDKKAVFSKYWHNDEYFYVHLIDEEECERAQSCESCKLAFPRKNLNVAMILLLSTKKDMKGQI